MFSATIYLCRKEHLATKVRLGPFLWLNINQVATNYLTKSRKPKSCLEIGFSMVTLEKKISSKRTCVHRKEDTLASCNVISLHQVIWHKALKVILEWYCSLILQQTRCMFFIGLSPCLRSTCFHCRGHSNKLKCTDVKETWFISCKYPSVPPTRFLGINFKRWRRPVWTCLQPTSSLLNMKACYLFKGKKGAQDNVFK